METKGFFFSIFVCILGRIFCAAILELTIGSIFGPSLGYTDETHVVR